MRTALMQADFRRFISFCSTSSWRSAASAFSFRNRWTVRKAHAYYDENNLRTDHP